APQQEGENPSLPQQQGQNPSDPPQDTVIFEPLDAWDVQGLATDLEGNVVENISLPPPPPLQTGIPHFNIRIEENTDSPVVDPTYTGETTDVTMTLRPQTPPPRAIEDEETDLMQDIRQATQTHGQPANPQDSPTTRVSTGAWALPKLPGS